MGQPLARGGGLAGPEGGRLVAHLSSAPRYSNADFSLHIAFDTKASLVLPFIVASEDFQSDSRRDPAGRTSAGIEIGLDPLRRLVPFRTLKQGPSLTSRRMPKGFVSKADGLCRPRFLYLEKILTKLTDDRGSDR